MTVEEFQEIVSQEPTLATPLLQAAREARPQQYTLGADEAALLVFMFPVAQFILTKIGLPWLHEANRYAELWRMKFHRWIDEQYQKHGFDPDQAEAAGDALREELEKTTGANAQANWERFSKLMGGSAEDAD